MVQITENDIVILGMSYPDFVKTYGEEMAKKRLRQLYGTDDIKQAIEIEKKRREEYLKQLEEESKKRYEVLAKPEEKKITIEETRGYLVGDELKTKTYTYDITVKPSGEIILPEGISEDVKAYIEKTIKDATKKNINLTKIKLGSGFLSRYGEYGVVGQAEGNKILPSGRLVFVQDMDSGKLTDMFVVDATQKVHNLDAETKSEIIKVLRSSKIPEGSVLEIRNNELIASKWQIMETQQINNDLGKITEELKKGVSIQPPETYIREEKSTSPIRYIPFIGGTYDIFVAVKGEEPVTVKKYFGFKEMIPVGTRTAVSPEILIENKKIFEKIETPERVLRGVIGAADVITSALLIKAGISYALKNTEKPLTLKMSQYSIQNEGKALVETRYFLNNKLITEIGKATVEEAAEKTALINYQPLLRTTLEKTKLGFIRQTEEFLKDEFSKIGVKKLIEGVESKKELNLIKTNIETPDEYLKISAFSLKQKTRGFEIGTVVSGTRELETAGLYKVIKTGKGRLTLITPEGLQEYQAESLAYISRSIGKAGDRHVKIDLIGSGLRLKEIGQDSKNFVSFSSKSLESAADSKSFVSFGGKTLESAADSKSFVSFGGKTLESAADSKSFVSLSSKTLESAVKRETSNIIVPIPEINVKSYQKNILPQVTLTQTFTKTIPTPSYTTGKETQEIIIEKPKEIDLFKQTPTIITPTSIGKPKEIDLSKQKPTIITPTFNIGRMEKFSSKMADLVKTGSITNIGKLTDLGATTKQDIHRYTETPTNIDTTTWTPIKTTTKLDVPTKTTTETKLEIPLKTTTKLDIPIRVTTIRTNIRTPIDFKIKIDIPKLPTLFKPGIESKQMDRYQEIAFKLPKIGSIYKPSVYAIHYNIKMPKSMKNLTMKTFFRPIRW